MASRSIAGSTEKTHQPGCESAEGLVCNCWCNGPGHGKAILERCLSCEGITDPGFAELAADLERIYGVFHRDPSTDQRQFQRGRDDTVYVPPPSRSAMESGKQASRFETVVLDDGVHEILLRTAQAPRTPVLVPLFDAITEEAIRPMAAAAAAAGGVGTKAADSHVWCSLTVEAMKVLAPRVYTRASPIIDYAAIAYPRRSRPKHPHAYTPTVRVTGLGILARAVSRHAVTGLSTLQLLRVLQLVAITSCTDVWQHAAVVRYAMSPLLPPVYPRPRHLLMPSYDMELSDVTNRWDTRGNW